LTEIFTLLALTAAGLDARKLAAPVGSPAESGEAIIEAASPAGRALAVAFAVLTVFGTLGALAALGSEPSPASLGAFTVLEALGALTAFEGADGCAASGISKVGSIIGKKRSLKKGWKRGLGEQRNWEGTGVENYERVKSCSRLERGNGSLAELRHL
jgi:hypothetical protein